jgi:glycosyltransferase involved in cell wall biosynthesis
MRILVTADPALPVPPKLYGGIERVIASLAEKLLAGGYEVGLIAHPNSTCKVTTNFAWPSNSADMFAHMRRVRATVRAFRPDIVHSFSRLLYLLPVLANRRLPKIMSFQREPTLRTVRWANRIARGSLSFTGCSEAISRRGREAGGIWQTIYNFVDIERFTFSPHVRPDAPFIFLSRVERIKGAHTAIAACREAGRRLIIAGNYADDDSPAGRYWREEIAPYLGRDGVEYVGEVNDKQKDELLGQAAALIVPIQWEEPFGIVFAEALACGTPVLSCRRGALPEIVVDGIHGFLSENLEQVIDSISRISSLDRKKCRERAVEVFSIEANVAKYEELYRALTRRS